VNTDNIVKELRCFKYWCGCDSPASRDIHPKICDEAADTIEALRAQMERESPKPCEFCDKCKNGDYVAYLTDDSEMAEEFRFCPMCGRKLEPKEAE
jgi:hypothetical protein